MTTRFPSATFFVLLLTFTVLAGCSGARQELPPTPSSSSTTSAAPAPLTAIPLAIPAGLQASYSYGPPFKTLRPVNFTVSVHSDADFAHSYRYQGCAACDGDIQYRLAPDGSWAHAEFRCLPPFPDTTNTECFDYVGGWAGRDGLRGPFFGVALIAGLPIAEDGIVTRAITFGTINVNVRLRVETVGPDRLQVSAMPESRNYPLRVFPEPLDCNIFTGRVLVDAALGLPVGCWIDEINPDDGSTESFGWNLTWTNVKPDAPRFTPTNLPVAGSFHAEGARFPPREGDDKMPFGLYEALDYAALRDGGVKEFLERPDVVLGNSNMFWFGGIRACPVGPCVKQDNYIWQISLRSGSEDLRFNVTKQVTPSPGGLGTYELESVYFNPPDVPIATFPKMAPHALSWYWESGQTATDIGPSGITYYATERGNPVNLEPFVGVGFRGPGTHGIRPTVYLLNDGTIHLFMANGAVPIE